MSIKLEIHPPLLHWIYLVRLTHRKSVFFSTMVGHLNSKRMCRSAYSLSGHISLSLTRSSSLFERRRPVRILLRSLVIAFEGQAELVTQEASYSAMRLCTISKELVSKTTIELSNEGHEGDGGGEGPSVWHIMFDLPIPGWLPRAISMETVDRVFQAHSTTSSPARVSPTNNVLHADRRRIMLNRFALPAQRPAYYSVSLTAGGLSPEDNPHPVPADIISKIELLASVPDRICLDQEKFPFSLSIRTSSLSESEAAKLHVTQFSLELQQNDQYSSTASAYTGRHPVPSPKNQPPVKSLREAHPIHTLYDIGLLGSPAPFTLDDSHSLLPGYDRVVIPLDTADYGSKLSQGMHPTRWLTMETKVPFTRSLLRAKEGALDWTGSPRLRETSQGPFFSVSHTLRVIVTLTYDDDDDDGKPPPTSFLALSSPSISCSQVSSSDTPAALPTTTPPTQQAYSVPELPAYSQLFYPNGDIRHDDSIPLPRYTPSPEPLPT
ncbi:hypothetical protein BGY98DRAFT_1094026 [Russula aff. rugulosa BPL654]|nr:hypothetical protein BGY98DRAFT_1094026 [Russula aff. rugulosa BPL654]